MKFIKLIFILFISVRPLLAQEGMWMPNFLSQNEEAMQKMGMKMTAEQLYSVNHSGIKDAIAIFGRGCTSEVVSNQGLLFTNHHCGFDAIQSLSSLEANYLDNGFWAKSFAEELPSPGLTATFVDKIIDVTSQVLAGVSDTMSPSERQSLIDKNIAKVQKDAPKEAYQTAKVSSFYKGNQFFLFIQTTYRDVRLVGTPPQSIGKFGADTDNWMWPRHTGDFSIFRIYANENNLPAEYASTNKPYTPKHFLPISLDGVAQDDFTMVMGFPGRTDEYLTSYAVKSKKDARNPAKVEVREAGLAVMDAKMKKDEATRLKYASKYAQIANYWKYWIGESKGLDKFNAVAEKEKYETDFTNRISKDPALQAKYGNILPRLKELYAEIEPLGVLLDYNSEIFSNNVELTTIAMLLSQLEEIYTANGEAAYNQMKPRFANYISSVYKDFDAETDQEVLGTLLDLYVKKTDKTYISDQILKGMQGRSGKEFAKELYANSILTNSDKVLNLMNGDFKDLKSALENDLMYKMTIEQSNLIDEKVSAFYTPKNDEIQSLMRLYMEAQMKVFTEKKFFPDANSTLRVSYGKVSGYEPKDGVYYTPFTYLDGVMEKYIPGDYEFDVPQKLIDLYNAKDFGQYADKNGKMPVCYLGTNHITGGNSGSPVIDAHGNLIGLAFDGVWEGTMADIYYTPETCMSIMVDARYVLFIIEKYGNAKNLIDELKLVHPKKEVVKTNTKKVKKSKK
jgi:hypothetical protein